MGRWERTHEALRQAAWELFTQRGYEATTTGLIAQRAGVSEMTLFRHFASKEELVTVDPFDPAMAEAVRHRPHGEPAMRALAEGVREAWEQVRRAEGSEGATTHLLRERLGLIARTPSLRGAVERSSEATIGALAQALEDRGEEGAQARVAASALVAGLSTALLEWAQSEHGGGAVSQEMSVTSLDAAIGAALDVLGVRHALP